MLGSGKPTGRLRLMDLSSRPTTHGTTRAAPLAAALPIVLTLGAGTSAAQGAPDAPPWTIHVVSSACSDYTWGFDEKTTRRNMAEVVRAHLDAMTRIDGEPEESRDRYTMSVTNEALAFLELDPGRRSELERRLREGRITLSPFLDNTLWGGQGDEAFLRSLYPARRLEREWGVPIDVAPHVELPSLPWGAATLLAGAGVRWLAVPFLDYDAEWGGLDLPPLFALEGPDGSRVRVALDAWASRLSNYAQGRSLLEDPKRAVPEWLRRFEGLGSAYPSRDVVAFGTHGDLRPQSADEVAELDAGIREWNGRPASPVRLRNDTLAGFCRSIDAAEARQPFLPTVRGDLGHSWEAWPVSLAAVAASARQAEREYLAAETFSALAGGEALAAATRPSREQAEWTWAMLADHAWNGSDDASRRENASLRRRWADGLVDAAQDLTTRSWDALRFQVRSDEVSIFNPTGYPRRDVVRLAFPRDWPARDVRGPDGRMLPSQMVVEDEEPVLYFVPPPLGPFAAMALGLTRLAPPPPATLVATATTLDGPFYRLAVDPRTGGLASLVHKPSGRDLVVPGPRAFAQTAYVAGGVESRPEDVQSDVDAVGPVLARLHVSYRTGPAETDLFVTIYADVDRVDLDYRVDKKPSAAEERLVHVFPVASAGATLRLDTTGAVVRPRTEPEGDLLKGANTRRFAVQGFVDASGPGGGVTIAPLDAFLFRNDLEPVTIEALGNDQNFKEVTKDQGGATEFRFRYALRARAGDYVGADAFAWSRTVLQPIQALRGRVSRSPEPPPVVDPLRAVVLALKPPDDPAARGLVLRLRETAGRSGPLRIETGHRRRAVRLDLLERELGPLPVTEGTVTLDLRAYGFAAVRLE